MNQSRVNTGDNTGKVNRRDMLGLLLGAGASLALPTATYAQSVNDIISTESFSDFQRRLGQYISQDNWRPDGPNGQNRGNMWKYQTLAKPLIEGGLTSLDTQKIQYLIAEEVGSAYDSSQTRGFRKYNENRIYNDNEFYGNIPGNPGISSHAGAIYDSRLSGQIDFNSPNKILSDLNLPQNQQDVAFVIKDANGLYCFVYYEDGRLKSICPCSPGSTRFGRGAVTPGSGLEYDEYSDISHYFLDDDQKRRRGETEDQHNARLQAAISRGETIGGSMPYSRRVLKDGRVDGYYTHIGEVNGRAASHGCIRLPAFWAYVMFYEANNGANIYYRPEYSLEREV